ncbi:MAG TPA: hypothetical protein VM389_12190 [Phycisphaerae bacterium]|nr:hypothetical protein [Phycisphaerae bacterium]HUU23284.1 hypothetical protein [Phycisphaerae bacterium]
MTDRTPNMIGEPGGAQASLPEIHLNRRTKICLWIILLGLANFLAYSVVYFVLSGEAIHGGVRVEAGNPAGRAYYVLHRGNPRQVSRGEWMYSAVHSISIPITVGAVLLAMLTVAKDRIVSSLRSSAVRGRALITLLAAVVTVCSLAWTAWFLHTVISQLRAPG